MDMGVRSTKLILAFGDSLTFGSTDFGQPPHPYTLSLEKQLNAKFPGVYSVWTSGDPGETTGEMNGRLPEVLLDADEPLHYCIILGGTNDLGSSSKIPFIWKNLQGLYELVKNHSPKCHIIALTIPQCFCVRSSVGFGLSPSKKKHTSKIGAPEYFADEKNGTLIDIEKMIPFSKAEGGYFARDGLHFNPAGYDFIGLEISKVIEELAQKKK